MNKESFAINCFYNEFIGDDAAVVDKFVYSKDLFFENSHFKRGWLSPYQIGQKSVLVNISDTITMNATPKYALLGLAFPKNFKTSDIALLSKGIKDTCDKFGVKIVGGDTISSDKICISITIIGILNGKAVYRNGLKNGDYLAFTGNLGQSLKGLKSLLNGYKVSKNSKFANPNLKDKFFYSAAKFINSSMDISDGLSDDLNKLLKANKMGIKFIKKLSKQELLSGEEYEILFSFSPKDRYKIQKIAQKTRTKITIFAKAKRGKFKTNVKNHHF